MSKQWSLFSRVDDEEFCQIISSLDQSAIQAGFEHIIKDRDFPRMYRSQLADQEETTYLNPVLHWFYKNEKYDHLRMYVWLKMLLDETMFVNFHRNVFETTIESEVNFSLEQLLNGGMSEVWQTQKDYILDLYLLTFTPDHYREHIYDKSNPITPYLLAAPDNSQINTSKQILASFQELLNRNQNLSLMTESMIGVRAHHHSARLLALESEINSQNWSVVDPIHFILHTSFQVNECIDSVPDAYEICDFHRFGHMWLDSITAIIKLHKKTLLSMLETGEWTNEKSKKHLFFF